jgi:adenylate kinase
MTDPAAKPLALNLALLGPPGCGKGTQARRLMKTHGYEYLSTGNLLRSEIRRDTPLGRQADAVIQQGRLMPDDLINQLIGQWVNEGFESKGGILLDGYPRTEAQFRFLWEILQGRGSTLDGVFFMEIGHDPLLDRLMGRLSCPDCGAVYHRVVLPPRVIDRCDECGGELGRRGDDVRKSILERLTVFDRKTYPMLEVIERRGCLIRIEADRQPDRIHEHLVQAIGRLEQQKRDRLSNPAEESDNER